MRTYCRRYLTAFAVIAVFALAIAAACGDDGNGDSTDAPVDGSATPAPIDETLPAVVAAREELLENVDVDPETLTILAVTATTFSDACLDVAELTATPEVCAQVITPGYVIEMQAGITTYTYHADESGSNVRFAGVDIGGD